jgi:hypothetical protein
VADLTKAVDSDLPYTFSYKGWPLFSTNPIVDADVVAAPSGLTISETAVSSDGRAVSVRIAGGSAATTYSITVTPMTAEGYMDPYTVTMEVTA